MIALSAKLTGLQEANLPSDGDYAVRQAASSSRQVETTYGVGKRPATHVWQLAGCKNKTSQEVLTHLKGHGCQTDRQMAFKINAC